MSELNKMDFLELEITDLAPGGDGFARAHDGRVVFVQGALAGEWVRARLITERKDFLRAQTVEVLSASGHRTPPRCPHYENCGGCDLMHLQYEAQVQAKTAWVEQALSRLGEMPDIRAQASPLIWGYRNRARLQVQNGKIGFFARHSKQLTPIDLCPVASAGINRLLPALAASPAAGKGPLPVWMEVLASEQGQAFLTLGFDQQKSLPPGILSAWGEWGQDKGLAGIRFSQAGRLLEWPITPQTGLLYYDQEDVSLRAFPGLFCQANFKANRLLIDTVKDAAKGVTPGQALELYAGSGNFTLPLARAGWHITAVERSALAAAACRIQAQQNGLAEAVETKAAPVGRELKQLVKSGRNFDLAVLDPPRAGAKGLMGQLTALKPRRVIYVSCHSATLARDAADLIEAGYQAVDLILLDMFPHTSKVESMLVLDKK